MSTDRGDRIDKGLTYRQRYERFEDQVHIYGTFCRQQNDASVLPGTEFEVSFYGKGLPVHLEVSALRGPGLSSDLLARIRQTQITPFDPLNPQVFEPGGGTGVSSFQAAVTIKLYPPGGGAPFEWNLPEGNVDWHSRRIAFPEGRPDPSIVNLTGWWRLTATPTSEFPVRMLLQGSGRLGTVPVRVTHVSSRLLNRVLALGIDAISPQGRMQDGRLRVWISDEMADLIGQPRTMIDYALPSEVTSAPSLETLTVEVVPGQRCLDILDERIAKLRARWNATPASPAKTKLEVSIGHLEEKRTRFAARANCVGLMLVAGFTDAPIESYLGVDVANIRDDEGRVLLAFDQQFGHLGVAALISVDYGTLANLADLIPTVEVPRDIDRQLETAIIERASDFVGYFRAAMGRLVGRDAVALDARWEGDSVRVEFFSDLPEPNPAHDPAPFVPIVGMPTRGGPPDPLGVFPPGFEVADGPALTRLDQTGSIVLIMMENRSFDHLLGDLPRTRPRSGDSYDGIPDDTTTAAAGGFVAPIPMVKARAIGLDSQIPVSPHHHFDPVMFQIGGGTPETAGSGQMQGFGLDLADRTNAPQIAMTYYTEADLPVYYRLADQYLVCDRWFSSVPGPTWPNRWVTVCGTTPEIDNPENDDPRIGYMTEPTIFETLTRYGIEWKYFESDLSLIRLFDRYRLDDTNVLPLTELDALLARSGPLPRVMVIEPNFVDVPGGEPNDDHPPADLAQGQAFVGKVLDMFRARGRFNQATFLINYDEHGGFYDHVAPPGTAHGDPAWLGRVPRIHPDGPDSMGVRVPAFVVSPYVAASSISHEVFDHTSFIKTVLVHNRARLPQSVFNRFGERVAKAAHVGQALNRDTPRPAPDLPFSEERKATPSRATWTDVAFDAALVFDAKTDHYVDTKTGWLVVPATGEILDAQTREPIPVAEAVARAPHKIVAPVRADAVRGATPSPNVARTRSVPPAQGDEPRDFHQALRHLCTPRRRYRED